MKILAPQKFKDQDNRVLSVLNPINLDDGYDTRNQGVRYYVTWHGWTYSMTENEILSKAKIAPSEIKYLQ